MAKIKRTLMYDVARCGARYQFGDGLDDDPANWCPEKDTCARHQAFIKWDAECGIPDYQQIPVVMGKPDCKDKIEVANYERPAQENPFGA